MPPGLRYVRGIDTALLKALFWEADKCLTVMDILSTLRHTLSPSYIRRLDKLCILLNSLRSAMLVVGDIFPLHTESIDLYLNHLDMSLPSISKTLDDIQLRCAHGNFYGNADWDRLMYAMSRGDRVRLELFGRLTLYYEFFDMLYLAMTQDPGFDSSMAEDLRVRIMDLRETCGITIPRDLSTIFVPFNNLPAAYVRRQDDSQPHWAVETVDRKPNTATPFDTECSSTSYGPFREWNMMGIPDRSKLLFRRSFDDDEISLVVFLNSRNRLPYALLRTTSNSHPHFKCRPLSEVRIKRSETKLHLSRWSNRQETFVHWAILNFHFFEELVVIQCTLLALKAQTSLLSKALSHDESVIRDDSKIWVKDIIESGVRHKLIIYRDDLTGTKRLYACVAKGERLQAYAPAWTIFFSDRRARPQLQCINDFGLIIHNPSLYTFGNRYTTPRHNPQHFQVTFMNSGDNRQLKYLLEESFKALQRAQD
ncbi:hypothetical protein IF1G_01954 [Cordyceps javanica]|uniref:Uncharacterized protein n=1 Tax=Cordyceps javanica TaxID=43265 RepID=A0A545W9B1_9HYPO|nr:hypothetical protein IF1G_01954 [Cordyceps javanica]TQW10587.1 hypothetical protein IF2G_01529 [Cordyceps javanica]